MESAAGQQLSGSFLLGNGTENTTCKLIDSEFRYKLLSVFYSFVFIFGLAANCYALYVLRHMRNSKAMNEIRIYMSNLTVADLLFVVALPLWIGYYAQGGNWTYSEVLCRITGSFFFINNYCSILFLMVISINRYWAITRPLEAKSSDCWRRGVVVSTAVWVATLGAATNNFTSPGLQKHGEVHRCFEGYYNVSEEDKNFLALTHFLIVAVFFVVFALVILCNVLIARKLLARPVSQSQRDSAKRPVGTKRKALRILCAVVGVFVVCFLPHHLLQAPWVLSVLCLRPEWSAETRQRLNDAHQITIMLMGFNCLLDPVVYCFATSKFRRYVKCHLSKVRNNQSCSRSTVSTGVSLRHRGTMQMNK